MSASAPDSLPVDTATRGDRAMQRWRLVGLASLAVIVATIPLSILAGSSTSNRPQPLDADEATFVGRERCAPCHEEAMRRFLGSDHDRAMEEATEDTVLGDFDDAVFENAGVTTRFYRKDDRFFVHTEGPGGEPGDFEVAYTFGYDPLQQYLLRFPGGRFQCLTIAWDVPGKRWFHLYPDQVVPPTDWLHWTRNAQNWNGMCAACHSTNLVKGYDATSDSYQTTWSEIDVSCEACHGPGSTHVAWAEIEPMARPEIADYGLAVRTANLSAREQVELCAPCHSRRTELGHYDHAGLELMDHMLPALLREGLYHPDGQIRDEVYVYGSFLQSKMYLREVRCSDCHDVHSLKPHHEGNALCLQCHQAEVYDSKEHHFHKKVHEGKPSDGALCVKCHMPEQPYMVVDWRADHSLRVPRPDLSAELGTPNACSQVGCHDDKPLQWSVDAYRKWYGEARRPHFGTTLARGRVRDSEARGELIRLAQDALYPPIVRATALDLLPGQPGEDVTAALRAALIDDEPLLRRTAIDGLALGDPRQAVEWIAPLLFDPVKAVRMAAASHLAGPPTELLQPYQRESYEKALAEFREAMEAALDFSFAGLNLGNVEARLGHPAKAEAYFRQALAVDDLFHPAKMNLAVLLSGQGRNAEAEKLLREVLAAEPEHHDAAYSLGLLLVEMDNPEEAVRWIGRAARGMPRNPRAHYNLGLLLAQLGRDAEAEVALRQATVIVPTHLDYLYALADFYLKRRRPSDARAVAEKMIAAHPEEPIGHRLRAMAEQMSSGR